MTRSIQRNIIRQRCYKRDGNTKAFHDEWEKFKYPRQEITNPDGTVTTKIARKGAKRKNIGMNRSVPFSKRISAFSRFIKSVAAAKAVKAQENT